METVSSKDLLRLDGHTAVVTGAGRGIGRAIADRLEEAGAHVVSADRSFSGQNGHSLEILADVSSAKDMHRCATLAKKEFGALNIWINNAGIFPPQDPIDVLPEEFARVISTNLIGVQNGIQVAAQTMRADGNGGVILNIASTAAYHYAGAYAASKWAVRGMTKGLAPVLGPDGIRIVALAPTLIETPGIEEIRESGGQEIQTTLRSLEKSLPLGRAGQPDDVARAALFLVSPAASFITGVTLPVDGGELAL